MIGNIIEAYVETATASTVSMILTSFVTLLTWASVTRVRLRFPEDPEDFDSGDRLLVSIITTIILTFVLAVFSANSGFLFGAVCVVISGVLAIILAQPIGGIVMVLVVIVIPSIVIQIVDKITLGRYNLINRYGEYLEDWMDRAEACRNADPAHQYKREHMSDDS